MIKFFIVREKNTVLAHLSYLFLLAIYILTTCFPLYYNHPIEVSFYLFMWGIILCHPFYLPSFIKKYPFLETFTKTRDSDFINRLWFYNLTPLTLALYNLCFAVLKLIPFLIATLIIDISLINFTHLLFFSTPILLIALISPAYKHITNPTLKMKTNPFATATYYSALRVSLTWRIVYFSGFLLFIASAIVVEKSVSGFGSYTILSGVLAILGLLSFVSFGIKINLASVSSKYGYIAEKAFTNKNYIQNK